MVIYHLSPEALEFSKASVCPPAKGFEKQIGIISMNIACGALCGSQGTGTGSNEDDDEEEMHHRQMETVGSTSAYEAVLEAVI